MAGSRVYARHGFVRWSAIVAIVAAFSLSTALYGLPLAVSLALLASCAYCGVTFLSFSLEGREGREKLEKAYDRLFSAVRGDGAGLRGSGGETRERSLSLRCHREAQKMIRLVMRDFVLEWYKSVTTEDEFPQDCERILEHVALEINVRIQQMDLDEAVRELLATILPYLEALNHAGRVEYNGVEIFDVRNDRCLRSFEKDQTVAHRALRSTESEEKYLRQLLDAVIQCALPGEYRNCDLTCLFLREILLRNILDPLLSLICDPDFLNKAIPLILKKADPAAVQTVLDHIQEENKELECAQLKGRLIQAHRRPTQRFHSMSEHYPISTKPIPVPLSRIYPDSFAVQGGGASVEEGEEEGLGGEIEEVDAPNEGEGERGRESSVEVGELSPVEEEVDGGALFSPSPTSSLGSSNSSLAQEDTPTLSRRGSFLGLPFGVRRSSSRRQTLPNASPRQQPRTPPNLLRPLSSVGVAGGVASSSSLESDPDLVCVELPPVFATRYIHVRHGNSTYIGYVFKFPKSMLLPGDQQDVGVASEETHLESVKRYSDFTRLHQQLQKNPELLRHAQGLDLPERHGFANVVSKLPFTSKDLDPTALLERKQGLEKYIQLMSSRQDILESRILQDFLKSGVFLLREINSLPLHKSRQKRTLLGGIMKGQSDEAEEAQPLPKRLMESVLSSFLNTTLPLPCRQLNTSSGTNRAPQTGKTGSAALGLRERRRRLVKAATIGESHTHDCRSEEEGEGRRRTVSLTDSDRVSARESTAAVSESVDSCRRETFAGEFDSGCHGNGISLETVTVPTQTQSRDPASESFLARARSHLLRFCSLAVIVIRTAVSVIRQCSISFTQRTLTSLTRSQQQRNPLGDVLLALGTEASRRHCPELWVTDRSTQTAVLTLVGGAIDRFLSTELREVVMKEESWMRALYKLRHTLWVEGGRELDRTPRETLTEGEREERKKEAIAAFRKFLPNFLPYLVGAEDYSHAVTHCLECLQNPQINRHFFLRVIDILLPKLIPELHSDEFQKRLARLRTLTSSHHTHKLPPHSRPLSTYTKKH